MGAPLLLLHGFPQTSAMWRDVAPRLTDAFEVICARFARLRTLRISSGASHKYRTRSTRSTPSLAMGQDFVALMQALGHERFFVVGHDRVLGGLPTGWRWITQRGSRR